MKNVGTPGNEREFENSYRTVGSRCQVLHLYDRQSLINISAGSNCFRFFSSSEFAEVDALEVLVFALALLLSCTSGLCALAPKFCIACFEKRHN